MAHKEAGWLTNACKRTSARLRSLNIFLLHNGLVVHHGSLPVVRVGQKPVMRGVILIKYSDTL